MSGAFPSYGSYSGKLTAAAKKGSNMADALVGPEPGTATSAAGPGTVIGAGPGPGLGTVIDTGLGPDPSLGDGIERARPRFFQDGETAAWKTYNHVTFSDDCDSAGGGPQVQRARGRFDNDGRRCEKISQPIESPRGDGPARAIVRFDHAGKNVPSVNERSLSVAEELDMVRAITKKELDDFFNDDAKMLTSVPKPVHQNDDDFVKFIEHVAQSNTVLQHKLDSISPKNQGMIPRLTFAKFSTRSKIQCMDLHRASNDSADEIGTEDSIEVLNWIIPADHPKWNDDCFDFFMLSNRELWSLCLDHLHLHI